MIKKRISFDFSEAAYEQLKKLKEDNDLTSKADVVRNALRLYTLFTERIKKDGYKIYYKKNELEERVDLLF